MLQHILALLWAVIALIGLQIIGGQYPDVPAPAPYLAPAAADSLIARPNCPEKCGNVTIPYPFGIGDGCFYNNINSTIIGNLLPHSLTSIYSVNCSKNDPPRAFIRNDIEPIEVVNITVDGELWVSNQVSYDCYSNDNGSGNITQHTRTINHVRFMGYYVKEFTFSVTKNSVFGYGCDTYVQFYGKDVNSTTRFRVQCSATCDRMHSNFAGKNNTCSGIRCCKASIPEGMNLYDISAYSISNHTDVLDFNPCSVAFAFANDAMPTDVADYLSQDFTYFDKLQLPVVYDWLISGVGDCETAKAGQNYICKGNSVCLDFNKGYRCQCKPGFEGNPYIRDCQDIDECKQPKFPCYYSAYCVNTPGSYLCLCPQGYENYTTSFPSDNVICVPSTNQSRRYKLLVGLSVTIGSILLFFMGCWLYKLIKRRQAIKQRALYFKKNGGLLLQQQQMSLGEGVVERTKIFTIAELRKATDNFSEDRILGQGGHGTVYKGMLGEGKLVAVKKSKRLEESEIREFINEVSILSQINHKNIVKLLGCCLETEVPLLVFEFIPNGTLFHHIHYPSEEFPITWKMRLQIASDSAGALAYLHHLSSIPIFHRDIKSSNILLDEKYRGKLSDFGTSRLVATDQTHVTTRVMGTFGYLDPEYFQTNQFTEKSDVYSFGVVLVELLTGQKAIRAISEQDRSLTSWFLSHMENSRLLDIVDSQILQENCKEEFHTIANLAKRCLNLDGKKRPSMKEVLLEIEVVLSLHLPQMNEPDPQTKPDEVFVTEAFKGSFNDCGSSSSTFNLESKSLSSIEASQVFTPR